MRASVVMGMGPKMTCLLLLLVYALCYSLLGTVFTSMGLMSDDDDDVPDFASTRTLISIASSNSRSHKRLMLAAL